MEIPPSSWMWKEGIEQVPEPYRALVKELLQALKAELGDRLVSLVVFGSVARGEARPDSDVDVLIIAEGLPRGRIKRSLWFCRIEEELDPLIGQLVRKHGVATCISPVLKTPEEAKRLVPLYLDMVEDAILIYDKGGFFKSVLERLRQKLEELGARRVKLGRGWYWVLKPDAKFGEVIEIE